MVFIHLPIDQIAVPTIQLAAFQHRLAWGSLFAIFISRFRSLAVDLAVVFALPARVLGGDN